MLNHLRKNTKLIVWIIVASFGIWGVGSVIISGMSGDNSAGVVYGQKISNQEFNRHYKLVQIFQSQEVDHAEPLAWQEIALVIKAQREKIKVTDDEVRQTLTQKMGYASGDFYLRWVKNVSGESSRVFEEKIRDLISVEKLLARCPTPEEKTAFMRKVIEEARIFTSTKGSSIPS